MWCNLWFRVCNVRYNRCYRVCFVRYYLFTVRVDPALLDVIRLKIFSMVIVGAVQLEIVLYSKIVAIIPLEITFRQCPSLQFQFRCSRVEDCNSKCNVAIVDN